MAEQITLPISLIHINDLISKILTSNNPEEWKLLKLLQGNFSIDQKFLTVCNSYNNTALMKYFVEELKADPIYDNGRPLRTSVVYQKFDNIKYLVEELKVDINLGDSSTKRNPIVNACEYGYLDILKYLVEHGADIRWVKLDKCSSNCREYVESLITPVPTISVPIIVATTVVPIVLKSYLGIKFTEKCDWNFPGLEQKEKNGEYYSVFPVEGPQEVESIVAKFSILKQLGENRKPEFFTL